MSQEQIQTAHKYIKRCFNALVVIKMQTKLTLTYCFILSMLANIKINKTKK